MKLFFLAAINFILYFSLNAFAQPLYAPPNFLVDGGKGKAVFVDFLKAEYQVVFDISKKLTQVKSIIQFQNDEMGMPIFDLVDDPQHIEIDGQTVISQLTETPHEALNKDFSLVRVIQKNISPGTHQMIIEHSLKAFPASYSSDRVESGFFMSDFEPRGLLERYLPVNFEFDQVTMVLKVSVIGNSQEELIFTNGQVKKLTDNQWSIQFPTDFNCSALYFHIRPKQDTQTLQYLYNSIDGRQLPVMIYTASGPGEDLSDFKKSLDQILSSNESLLGPFPHDSITVFISGIIGGGMEYTGALSTDLDNLPHELTHSYFGRGIMPANGNAGWIDEAMTSLIGGPQSTNPTDLKPMNMAHHSAYFRANDTLGYYYGQNFLMYLGKIFTEKDPSLSMNGFLKYWLSLRSHQVITTEILRSDMEHYSGLDLSATFKKFVYESL